MDVDFISNQNYETLEVPDDEELTDSEFQYEEKNDKAKTKKRAPSKKRKQPELEVIYDWKPFFDKEPPLSRLMQMVKIGISEI
jgi:hypothetical protein